MSDSDEKLDLVTLGTAIRIAREKANLSQEDIADILNVGRSTVYRVESGIRCPTLDYVFFFSRSVNIPMEQLLDPDYRLPNFISKYQDLPSKQRRIVDKTVTALIESFSEFQ